MAGVCRWHGAFPGERCGVITRRGQCKAVPNKAPAIANENPLASLAVSLAADGVVDSHRYDRDEMLEALGGGCLILFKQAHKVYKDEDGDFRIVIASLRAAGYLAGLIARIEGWISAATPDPRGESGFTGGYSESPVVVMMANSDG